MNEYISVLKNYVGFSGRASRREFWMFVLVNAIISFAISLVFGFINRDISDLVQGLYILAIIIPNIALSFRRLHDINKSAWWYLLILIPIVGAIILIVWAIKPGDTGPNQYGPDPKGTDGSATSAATATTSAPMAETAPVADAGAHVVPPTPEETTPAGEPTPPNLST